MLDHPAAQAITAPEDPLVGTVLLAVGVLLGTAAVLLDLHRRRRR